MSGIDITDWTKLGSLIRSARKSAGLTQHELAERSGTARSWIARIEDRAPKGRARTDPPGVGRIGRDDHFRR